tara:strand:- start:251 stop:451 length:201 start_codon:yes stop_codon:yes gene_type:complete
MSEYKLEEMKVYLARCLDKDEEWAGIAARSKTKENSDIARSHAKTWRNQAKRVRAVIAKLNKAGEE